MSTTAAAYGFRPFGLLGGGDWSYSIRHIKIASAYGTAIFYGDAVKLVTGGTDERDTFDAAMTPIGVFLGCSFTDPGTSQPTFKQYFPASTAASDIQAYVADATDLLFKVAVVSSGTTIGDLAITDIGANVAGVNNAGSTITGNSKCAISDTSATTNTLPFRIVDLVPETTNSSGGFTEALVKWNAGHAFDNTTGVQGFI